MLIGLHGAPSREPRVLVAACRAASCRGSSGRWRAQGWATVSWAAERVSSFDTAVIRPSADSLPFLAARSRSFADGAAG